MQIKARYGDRAELNLAVQLKEFQENEHKTVSSSHF